MHLSPLRLGWWLSTAVIALASHAVDAGTIRDDRDPALYTSLASDPAYQSVGLLQVSVFEEGQPAVGSATLVAPDWVLTAAHVVEGGRAINFTVGGQTYVANRWVSHPKYTGNLITGYDLALVQLSQAVSDVVPAQIYRKRKERTSLATFVGFGRTGNGLTGDITDDRLKRAGTNIVDGQLKRDNKGFLKVIEKLPSTARTFAVDFDSPSNPLESRMGSELPTDLEYLISRGDSGGGVFIDDPNDLSGPLLAGIHSFGEIFDERDDSDYGDLTGHTRVSSYKGWIDKTITQAGFQRKLNFITPTVSTPSAFSDPTARSLPATAIPEPAATLSLLASATILALRRRQRA
ncbi:S1 family peptidase [Humisphaera borealis]|uniref:Trypsin-like serine protease n=1 Tax=Humisphaera borealis TaxID=2807512 RepID=A0A7M2WT97_9BACT|nr:trypsin-like serine protease [Humisphaera borealis]QOV88737.1 trypsin-like serine protease [Humisphaera borealis]